MFVLKNKCSYIDNLRKRIKELEEAGRVKVGYFEEQGLYVSPRPVKTPYNITYPQLAAIQFGGSLKNNIPARPVLDITIALYPVGRNKNINKVLNRYLSNLSNKIPPITSSQVFEYIGEDYVEKARGLFGSSYLDALQPSTIESKTRMGAPYTTSPLLEWGTLRAGMSMKVNGVVITPK